MNLCNELTYSYYNYPFGMMLPNTNVNPVTGETIEEENGYRYGYNGMEKDDEVSGNGNSYDFGARLYNARVGRWLSGDCFESMYPSLSPFSYSGLNPILFVDVNGDVIVDPKTKKTVVKVEGEWKTILKTDSEGNPIEYGEVSDKFNTVSKPTLETLISSEAGTSVYNRLQAIPTEVIIDTEDEYNKAELEEKGTNSEWSTRTGSTRTDKDGFYKSTVIITPNLEKIKETAEEDGIDFEEKLIQVLSVETGHLQKDQIVLEQSVGYNLLKDAETATKTYGNLLKKAVEDGINYRKEKNQKIDDSSNIPIQRFNKSTGATIEEISIPDESETENTNN